MQRSTYLQRKVWRRSPQELFRDAFLFSLPQLPGHNNSQSCWECLCRNDEEKMWHWSLQKTPVSQQQLIIFLSEKNPMQAAVFIALWW